MQIDDAEMRIVGTGKAFEGDDEATRYSELDGYPVAWPVRRDGRLGVWRVEPATLMDLVNRGYAYVSSFDARRQTYSLKYLLEGTVRLVESGQVPVARSGKRGQVEAAEISHIGRAAKTIWYRPSHNAGKHGSDLLAAFVPEGAFDYPKSLYAVEDTLRLAVLNSPRAVVLDFWPFGFFGDEGGLRVRL